jgi:U5 small nuclear ribonucleoprotein component
MSIVLAEDKQYYRDAAALYEGAETILQEEDNQPIDIPIIAPTRFINFDLVEDETALNFSYEYLREAMKQPNHIRTVSLIGALHSGKTSFVDLMVKYVRDTRSQKEKDAQMRIAREELKLSGNQATDSPWDNFKLTPSDEVLRRYTDTRLDERERGISTKSMALSYMLPDSRGKSYLINLIDTPGHVNFRDESDVACRISDGVVVVVDCVAGFTECLKQQIRSLITVGGIDASNLVLVLSQLDRLILELRLPPTDAYFKLKFIIDDANVCIAQTLGTESRTFRPETGNVVFGSGKFKFCFSLESFAHSMYVEPSRRLGGKSFIHVDGFNPSSIPEEAETLGRLFWGDMYCDDQGSFSKQPSQPGVSQRTFVQFVLEPLYKIMSACVSAEKEDLAVLVAEIGVYLPSSVLDMDVEIVIESVMEILFPGVSPFVDSLVKFVPSAVVGGNNLVSRFYRGSLQSQVGLAMSRADPSGPLIVHCVKSYHTSNCQDFRMLGRVMSGTLTQGQTVRVLGESYSVSSGETEDQLSCSVGKILIPGGRYFVETPEASAGNIVVIEGLSGVRKTCTLTSVESSAEGEDEGIENFRPIAFSTQTPVIKVSCEPLLPADLPRLVEALRRLDRAYPQLTTRVEESGEHVIIGTGELYLDSALHDLRKLYGGDRLLEIKLSDPVVVFNETCSETSQFQCSAASPNKLNALSFIAEPLTQLEIDALTGENSERLRSHVEREKFFLSKDYRKDRNMVLEQKCGWDALAARNLWAFGPDWSSPSSSCILLNDTIPDQVSKQDLLEIREGVVQGFQWACREGPLLEEPVRGIKVKLLDAVLHGTDDISRGTGQIIPTACRAIYASILTAGPRLLEPVNLVEIETPQELQESVLKVLSKRRGHIIRDQPVPGTMMISMLAHVPAIESFGLETDLRLHTRGMGFCLSWFDHWAVLPGDPLDVQVSALPPLEPAPHMYLARDFLLKTRRRKGLAEEVVVQKYLDDVVGLGLTREGENALEEEDEYY